MTPDYPRLNFPAVKLRISQRGEQTTVWDPLRGIYLVLTPEEWVRRHLIGFLISHCGAQPMRIVQEYAVAMNGSPQRADVVVVDDRACPLMLVECKAAGIGIDRQVLAQAVRYNSVLGAPLRGPDQRPGALLLRVCRGAIYPYGPFSPLVSHRLYAGLMRMDFSRYFCIRIYFG